MHMSQKVQEIVETPRMWYMNKIVDMLKMKRQVPTTQTNRRRKRWKRTGVPMQADDDLDARSGLSYDKMSSLCLKVDAHRSRVNRDPDDDPTRQHNFRNER